MLSNLFTASPTVWFGLIAGLVALPILIHELTTGTQWERLHAAIVLDEIDEQARPVVEQMKEGLKYQKGFNSDGKYRVRVTNRALNELLGTNNTVK